MKSKQRLASLAGAGLLAVALTTPSFAATSPRAWGSPGKVTVGTAFVLHGQHLKANTYYALLLAVPAVRHGAQERLFGPVKTDRHGNVAAKLAMPRVTKCGKATIYLTSPKVKKAASFKVTLIGCSGKTSTSGLPKPPSPPKQGPNPPAPPGKQP